MLVLTRKPGESIVIGNGVHVTLLEIRGNRVRLGITAPNGVTIVREELVTETTTVADSTAATPAKQASGRPALR